MCVDKQTNPPPDLLAWLILGLILLALVMILILAAVVVHRKRRQAQQSQNMRFDMPEDYETPVLGQAATLKKERPPYSSSTIEKQKPPAYSSSPYSSSHATVSTPLAGHRKTGEAEVSEGTMESKVLEDPGNEEPVRQPIFLAAVAARKQAKPPLAQFVSPSKSSSNNRPLVATQSGPKLLPSHDEATMNMANSNGPTGAYQHLLFKQQSSTDKVSPTEYDISSSTSGFFGEDAPLLSSGGISASNSDGLPDVVGSKASTKNDDASRRQGTLKRQRPLVENGATPSTPPPQYESYDRRQVRSSSHDDVEIDMQPPGDSDGLICVI